MDLMHIHHMKANLFFYTETNHRPWREQVALGAKCMTIDCADTATLADIMTAAPRGSARSGVFEVQTDRGVFTHHDPKVVDRGFGRLDAAKAIFTKWD